MSNLRDFMPEVKKIKQQIYSESKAKKLCAITRLEEMENNFSDSTKSTLESDDEDKKSSKRQDFDENGTEGHISKEKNVIPQQPCTKSNEKKITDVIFEQTTSNSNNLPQNKGSEQQEFENYGKRGSGPQSGSDKEWNVSKGKKPVSERLPSGRQEEWRIPKENGKTSQPGTSTAASNKFNHDPLISSPRPLKITPQSPQLLPPDNLESVEIDQFEDSGLTPSLQSNDNKLHAKKAVKKDRVVSSIVPTPGSHGPKIDPNRVNELDRFCNLNTKTFMNNYLRPQNEFKKCPFRELSMAGTSSSWKRIRKANKDKEKTVAQKKVPENITALDDAKSITNCIIKNSLNIIEAEDEIIGPQSQLIHNLVDSIVKTETQDALRLISEVENGDLENNTNENDEGNRLSVDDIEKENIVDEMDDLNDDQAEFQPLLNDINDLVPNNNSTEPESHTSQIGEQEEQGALSEPVADNDTSVIEAETDSVAQASREVLYDVNSEQDLLDDFDIPPQASHDNAFDAFGFGHSVLLVGVHPINSTGEDPPIAGAIQTNPSSFPNWLLQILGSQVVPEEGTQVVLGGHDEPHFYCQGDGLGVHPSVIAVEVDEADDADNDTTTTEESSSNNSADYAEVDPGPSDMFDMSSLPEESPATSVTEENTLRAADSVVLSERTQNEDATGPSNCALVVSQTLAEGNNLVNEVIRTAEEEVHQRLLDVDEQENGQDSPSNSLLRVEEQFSLPKLSRSNIMNGSGSEMCSGADLSAFSSGCCSTTAEYITSSDSSGLSEQEVNGNSLSVLGEPSENPVLSENEQQNVFCNLARPNSIHEVKSSSTSEKSEYFDL